MENRVSENINLNLKMMSSCRVKYSERHKNSLMIKTTLIFLKGSTMNLYLNIYSTGTKTILFRE
jgi:hypothetical protein